MNIENKSFITGIITVLLILTAIYLTWITKPEFTEVRITETIEYPTTIIINASQSTGTCTLLNGEPIEGDCSFIKDVGSVGGDQNASKLTTNQRK